MHLAELRARNLRNVERLELSFPSGLTVVGGANGQGKTSLLEAAYLLATGRSFRTRRLEELVAWRGGPLSVTGRVVGRRGSVELAVGVAAGERTLLVNGAPRGLESFLGRLDVVDLTAERMAVLRGGPEERRRFLDRGVVGLDPTHLRVIGEYRRTLGQRNALLRQRRSSGSASGQLDVWDERLALAAAPLHARRREYARRLAEKLATLGPDLLPAGVQPRLAYKPSPPAAGEVAAERLASVFMDRVANCRDRDRELGHTSEGPHRDELAVELNGVDLRRFGSAGQVRAAMIALKLGKLSLLSDERGDAPLFLMDDFDTDLDDARMGALAAHLGRAGSQAVVATSKEEVLGRIGAAELKLRMQDGEVRVA